MNILSDIQQSIISDQNIAPVLLKLRLLAAKLGSKELESWIQYESEGYPDNIKPPDYRKIPVSYRGNFSGPFGRRLQNAPIPNILIEDIAGKQWLEHRFSHSISSIESLISNSKGVVYIDTSDLILLLNNKIYEQCNCISVQGIFSDDALVNIQNIVRHRILEFTIQLEKSIPAVASINIAQNKAADAFNKQKISEVFNQTIQGNLTVINSSGHNVNINTIIGKGNKSSLIDCLVSQNFPENSAKEFVDIVASEKPASEETPFGEKASQWIRDNLPKISEICKMTYSAVLRIIEKAVSQYYGV